MSVKKVFTIRIYFGQLFYLSLLVFMRHERVVVAALQALAAVLLRPSTSPLLRLKSFRCRGLEVR